MLCAVVHTVLLLSAEGDLVFASEQESLTELLLEGHAVKGTELRAQPLEQVGAEAVALRAHQLARQRERITRRSG